MALIDSDNFITHLVRSGLVDKATCDELKESIELCTIKDIYTKDEVIAMFEELKEEFKKLYPNSSLYTYLCAVDDCSKLTQQKIDALKVRKND